MTSALLPIREAVAHGPWPNRELLMLPLGSGTALAAQAAQISAGGPVAVHVTPRAGKPRHAWQFVAGAWNRLNNQPGGQRQLPTELGQAVPAPAVPQSQMETLPMGLDGPGDATPPGEPAAPTPFPTLPTAPLRLPVPGATQWGDYAERVVQLKGAVSCCVFDVHTLQPLAHAGSLPSGERLAQQGAQLLFAMADSARALGLSTGHTEAAITTGAHHLVLRPVPGHPGVALHLILEAAATNLTLARMQLERVASPA